MFLRRVAYALVAAAVQGSDYGSAGVGGLDDVIYIAQFGSKVRVCEFVLVFLYACGNVFGLLLAVKYAHGSLGTHHGNLGAWISKVDVCTYLLGIHHDICSAISLAGDEGDFRDGGLCKSIDDFGTVTYDSGVFLLYARQEARNVLDCHNGNVERVAELDESCRLVAGINVYGTGKIVRLICHETH